MKKFKSNLVLVLMFVLIIFCNNLYSQQTISDEKKALIVEIYQLTSFNKYAVNQELQTSDIKDYFMSLIKNEKNLTSEQRKTLENEAELSSQKVLKNLETYLSDGEISTNLLKNVFVEIYDKEFTVDELKDLVEFYKTDVGKKNANFLVSLMNTLVKDYRSKIQTIMSEFLSSEIKKESDVLNKKIKAVKK